MNDFLKKSLNKTQQAGNIVKNNVVNPLVDSLSEAYKPITDYVDPRGYAAERRNPALGNEKFKKAVKAAPMAAFKTYGATRMGVTAPLTSGALGGAISKATGGNFQEGFQHGVKSAPSVAAVSALSAPFKSAAGRISTLASTPIKKFIAERTASGVANIPESMAMAQSTGQTYAPEQTITDFLAGAVTGNAPQPTYKSNFTFNPMHKDDVQEVFNLFQKYKNVKNLDSFIQYESRNKNVVDALADAYLDNPSALKNWTLEQKITALMDRAGYDFDTRFQK